MFNTGKEQDNAMYDKSKAKELIEKLLEKDKEFVIERDFMNCELL